MAKPRYKSDRKSGPRKPLRRGDGQSDGPNKRTGKPPRATSTAKVDANATTRPVTKDEPPVVLAPRKARAGKRLPERTGLVLECLPNDDYAVLDSGNGEKLERYGNLTIRRPEGQAVWLPLLAKDRWDKVDAIFTGDQDEEGQGRWRYPKKPLPETWPLAFDGIPYFGRFTSFRHTGVFPEQATHWLALQSAIRAASKTLGRPVRMLNLFGYTGLASLAGARAGAEVTHVDASKKAVGWARENQDLAGLQKKPIRWICDDAMKFCARDVRRGQTYDIILLDPPSYGRGPKGEVWQLFDHLPHMLDLVRDLQSDKPIMTVLTAYAIRASHFAIHELMQEVFTGMNGKLESGELILRQLSNGDETGRALSTSMFSKFIGEGHQGD